MDINISGNIFMTGGGGMVGSHLAEFYAEFLSIENIISSYFEPTINLNDIRNKCTLIEADVRNIAKIEELLLLYKPSIIYHLAAQSLPVRSWEQPAHTFEVNVLGTINVLESIKKIRESDEAYDPVVVIACSSAEYGASFSDKKLTEESLLLPLNPYGVSKVAQDLLGYQYFQNFNIKCIRARIFNTTGTRKKDDVVSDFISRALSLIDQKEKILEVGNTNTKRAILDVRDLVKAFHLLTQKGKWGEAYNICSDQLTEINEIILLLEKCLNTKFNIQQSQKLFRPSDEAVIFGDTSKLKSDTGWVPEISLKKTIMDTISYNQSAISKSIF